MLALRVLDKISTISRWLVLMVKEKLVPTENHQFVGDNLYITKQCINIYCILGRVMMFNANFNNRKPDYPDKTTDLPQVTILII